MGQKADHSAWHREGTRHLFNHYCYTASNWETARKSGEVGRERRPVSQQGLVTRRENLSWQVPLPSLHRGRDVELMYSATVSPNLGSCTKYPPAMCVYLLTCKLHTEEGCPCVSRRVMRKIGICVWASHTLRY